MMDDGNSEQGEEVFTRQQAAADAEFNHHIAEYTELLLKTSEALLTYAAPQEKKEKKKEEKKEEKEKTFSKIFISNTMIFGSLRECLLKRKSK